MDRGTDFKELAHTVVEGWCSQSLQGELAGWGPREVLTLQVNLKAICRQNSFLLRKRSVFVLFGPSIDQTRPTHRKKSNLLFSKPTTLISSKNTFTETSRLIFDHRSGCCGPAKWTYNIKHYNLQRNCYGPFMAYIFLFLFEE